MLSKLFFSKYFLILIAILNVLLAYFPFRFGFDYIPNSWIFSIVFNIIFSIPLIYVLVKVLRGKNFVKIFASLSVLGYIVESTGVYTGFPYSNFEYTDQMGPLFLNLVPYSLSFGWVPMVLASMVIFSREYFFKNKIMEKIFASLRIFRFINRKILYSFYFISFLVAFDLVLDPGAVYLNLWIWEINGIYYGVPLMNYFGWILSSFLALMLILIIKKLIFKENNEFPFKIELNQADYKIFSITPILYISFWTGITLFAGLYIAGIIGLILILIICLSSEFESKSES